MRIFETILLVYLFVVLGISLAFFMLVSYDRDLLSETSRKVDVPSDVSLAVWVGSFLVIAVGGGILVRMTKRGYRGKSAMLTALERSVFARADRTFRPAVREVEIEILRAEITRETYEQVMEQQRRGLLCPNCKGQGPGQRWSA